MPEIDSLRVDEQTQTALLQFEEAADLTVHMNREQFSAADCPFLAQLGAAGIELAERMQAQASVPAAERPATIAELLAARTSSPKPTSEPALPPPKQQSELHPIKEALASSAVEPIPLDGVVSQAAAFTGEQEPIASPELQAVEKNILTEQNEARDYMYHRAALRQARVDAEIDSPIEVVEAQEVRKPEPVVSQSRLAAIPTQPALEQYAAPVTPPAIPKPRLPRTDAQELLPFDHFDNESPHPLLDTLPLLASPDVYNVEPTVAAPEPKLIDTAEAAFTLPEPLTAEDMTYKLPLAVVELPALQQEVVPTGQAETSHEMPQELSNEMLSTNAFEAPGRQLDALISAQPEIVQPAVIAAVHEVLAAIEVAVLPAEDRLVEQKVTELCVLLGQPPEGAVHRTLMRELMTLHERQKAMPVFDIRPLLNIGTHEYKQSVLAAASGHVQTRLHLWQALSSLICRRLQVSGSFVTA